MSNSADKAKISLIPLVSLTLTLCNCAVSKSQLRDAFVNSARVDQLSTNWRPLRDESGAGIVMVPRGSDMTEPGDFVLSGDVAVRWFVPRDGTEFNDSSCLRAQATEGAIALQVASARWVTVDNAQHYAGEMWDAALIGSGLILRSVAESAPQVILSGDED